MVDLAFVSSEFDIFVPKPVQKSIRDTYEVVYKPLAPIGQSDLEFLITADLSTYVNPVIKLYIRGKFTKSDGGDLDTSDHTAGVNNFLHSLFSQCTITLNCVNKTESGDHYNYRAYLETLLTYGVDASLSHLTNSYWYKDVWDMLPDVPTNSDAKNTGFVERWNPQKQSKEIEMYGRIYSDVCNVPKFLLPDIKLHIKFTKAKPSFYLMHHAADSKTVFKFIALNCLLNVLGQIPGSTMPTKRH
jgi:hypothetical protein